MDKLSVVGAFIVMLTWQTWTIDSAQLRSKHNDCLEQIEDFAYKRECWLRDPMQNWTYFNNTLKNQATGKCLTAEGSLGRPYKMRNCNPTAEEIKKWGMRRLYDDIRFNVTTDGMVSSGYRSDYCLSLNSKRDETENVKCDKKNKDIVHYT
jgi:hypothetical protein